MDGITVARDGRVATIRLSRPPHNFFDVGMIRAIADVVEANDIDQDILVTLLTAEGRNFCAGADFTKPLAEGSGPAEVYGQAARIFSRSKPLVAAVRGGAIGGGFGLALAADFRVVAPTSRFHANFASIGLHPGFAITATLPALVGAQRAADLLLTARRVDGAEAFAIALADRLVDADTLDESARDFCQSIAANAPLALSSIRSALQRVDELQARAAMAREIAQQNKLFDTEDFKEGMRASVERRSPVFVGR
jgi:enoyl-CoA hydratase/carnithine racemase